MAVITDAGADWSAGTTLSADEIWQVREGNVALSVESSPAANDGIILGGDEGCAVKISSGKTVKYKLYNGTAAVMTREAF